MTAAMIHFGVSVCVAMLAILVLPAELTASQEGVKEEISVGTQLLRVTNEMWFLLSGVVDKPTADAAAAHFKELSEKSSQMSAKLFDANSQAIDIEALDQDTYRLAEAYEDLSYEFESLCRARCYGSTSLISAFLAAMRLGVFSDDSEEFLENAPLILNEDAVKAEIKRLQRMEKPDQELLQVLVKVQDARTATEEVAALHRLEAAYSANLPEIRLRTGNFPEKSRAELRETCSVLEPLLWKIRNEIVRIVSLPGYDDEAFDAFSDALDIIFDRLSDTHAECFDQVFDASFRSDLDDALHENITSS